MTPRWRPTGSMSLPARLCCDAPHRDEHRRRSRLGRRESAARAAGINLIVIIINYTLMTMAGQERADKGKEVTRRDDYYINFN